MASLGNDKYHYTKRVHYQHNTHRMNGYHLHRWAPVPSLLRAPHQVNGIVNSNSPSSRRAHTLPAEVLSLPPLHASDLKFSESINKSSQAPRPVLPPKRITSNSTATFNAREHLMFMLRRRRRGGKFTPNTNN